MDQSFVGNAGWARSCFAVRGLPDVGAVDGVKAVSSRVMIET